MFVLSFLHTFDFNRTFLYVRFSFFSIFCQSYPVKCVCFVGFCPAWRTSESSTLILVVCQFCWNLYKIGLSVGARSGNVAKLLRGTGNVTVTNYSKVLQLDVTHIVMLIAIVDDDKLHSFQSSGHSENWEQYWSINYCFLTYMRHLGNGNVIVFFSSGIKHTEPANKCQRSSSLSCLCYLESGDDKF